MVRQIDQGGHLAMISTQTTAFIGQHGSSTDDLSSPVAALRFSNENPSWEDMPNQIDVVSDGIKPGDEIAKECGIQIGRCCS